MNSSPDSPDKAAKIYESIEEIAILLSVLEEQCHLGLPAFHSSGSELVEAAVLEDQSADLEDGVLLNDWF